MSLFITFEGIEGSGKTTQIKLLDAALKKRGLQTVLTREPGGTSIGDQIRHILLSTKNSQMTNPCEILLYAAARAQHVQELIMPALKADKIVLCDRFCDATLAYQGNGRGLSLELINQLNHIAAPSVTPHLTFLLDCDPLIGLGRSKSRLAAQKLESAEGRFEEETLEFHQRVRDGYLELAQREPDRIRIIPADTDESQIHQKIISIVDSYL